MGNSSKVCLVFGCRVPDSIPILFGTNGNYELINQRIANFLEPFGGSIADININNYGSECSSFAFIEWVPFHEECSILDSKWLAYDEVFVMDLGIASKKVADVAKKMGFEPKSGEIGIHLLGEWYP